MGIIINNLIGDNMDINDIDIERLRRDLIDYYSAAMFIASPVALVDLTKVETASDEELINIAKQNHIDLFKYKKTK